MCACVVIVTTLSHRLASSKSPRSIHQKATAHILSQKSLYVLHINIAAAIAECTFAAVAVDDDDDLLECSFIHSFSDVVDE